VNLMSSRLDEEIDSALRRITAPAPKSTSFDIRAYIAAFQKSAREKAASVLEAISTAPAPFDCGRPVFLSIGGGDGEEVLTLLENSSSTLGILVESVRELADSARQNSARLKGKALEVLQGDAADVASQAVRIAEEAVEGGRGDFLAISCHAVVHELFDRSERFDPTQFFGTLFRSKDIPIWFTYREPGAPEKWPVRIVLTAACTAASLLELAKVIRERNKYFMGLRPVPHILGDGVCMHKTLGMEVLAKLPYLGDLEHEINERSTAVDHLALQNILMLAIGDEALRTQRAMVKSSSAPTASFEANWQALSIDVRGLDENGNTMRLAISESQTRVIAWRIPESLATRNVETVSNSAQGLDEPDSGDQIATRPDLRVAEEALQTDDGAVLSAVMLSHGRRWIESAEADAAMRLLRTVRTTYPAESIQSLWAHYLISLAELFSGRPEPSAFSESYEKLATGVGLGLLFRAERMEFARKAGNRENAAGIANSLIPAIPGSVLSSASDLERYAVATCRFVLANLLRYGGLYREAWNEIEVARRIYRASIESQATELAHCHYAKTICVALTGVADFDLHMPDSEREDQRFASALIELAYAHAEWFVGDVHRAAQFASNAALSFDSIGSPHYADRARVLAWLLNAWNASEISSPDDIPDLKIRSVAAILKNLLGSKSETNIAAAWFENQRPSTVLGLLQFARRTPKWSESVVVKTPATLYFDSSGKLAWRESETVSSLEELDSVLRGYLHIPITRRIPLITD
jgi:hypothetical protein